MALVFRETVSRIEWEDASGAFLFERIQECSGTARLVTPDGEVFELGDAHWLALATAIARVIPSVNGRGIHSPAASPARPNAGQPWTPDQDADLRRRWLSGEPMCSVAKFFGRSSGAIAARLVRLGLADNRSEARSRSGSLSALHPVDGVAVRKKA